MNEFAKRRNYQVPEIKFLVLSDEDIVTKSVGVDYSSTPWARNGLPEVGESGNGGAEL